MPESYMEKALQKLANQIVAYDEASLMDLWEKYAEEVRQFEPTRHWEEAALIFGVIQAVRMKNQLFNYNLHASRQPGAGPVAGMDIMGLTAPDGAPAQAEGAPRTGRAGTGRGLASQGKVKAGKLIPLRPGVKD
jgi:hypothetical protein